jgi:membrane protein involved in colicin uptake
MIPSTRRFLLALAPFLALALLAPRPAAAAAAKTVICKDGSTDEAGRGSCSGHGGVDKVATEKAEAKALKAEKAEKAKAEKAKAKEAAEEKSAKAKAEKAKAKEAAEEKAAKGKEKAEKVKQDAGAKAEHATKSASSAAEKPAAAAKETKGSMEKADPAKGPPTARCKDGSFSYAEHHTGACSNHGGVEAWLDGK